VKFISIQLVQPGWLLKERRVFLFFPQQAVQQVGAFQQINVLRKEECYER